MSGAIEQLTAALEANTAAIQRMIELSGGAKPAAASKSAAASKPAAASKSAAASKPATGKKKTTVDDLAEAFGNYLGVKDKAEREERKANVKAIVSYFGVARVTEINPDSFDEAIGYLQTYIDGGTPEFDGAPEEGDEEDALV